MKIHSANAPFKIVKKEALKPEEKMESAPVPVTLTLTGTGIISDSASGSGKNLVPGEITSRAPMSPAAVDVPPEFPGGEKGLLDFLSKNIRYPVDARINGITGRVYISFVVNEKGGCEDAVIMHGPTSEMNNEVMRVVGIMPGWKPGQFHGSNVKTALVLPVLFSLK
jgi:TonB family protein